MSLQFDITHFQGPDNDNFSVKLAQLYSKADGHNRALIKQSFPNLVTTFEFWKSHPLGTVLPDLPYD